MSVRIGQPNESDGLMMKEAKKWSDGKREGRKSRRNYAQRFWPNSITGQI
jgi:hypothetical protein